MTKGDNNIFKAVLKKYFRKEDVFLVPNILCYFRIILVVIFLVIYLLPENILPNPLGTTYIAIAILVTAAYTDFVDGFIARRFNQISNLGKVLDPIADKLLQFGTGLAILIRYHMFASIWVMFAVFLVKEIFMFFETLILTRRNKTFGQARWHGKVSSFILYAVIATLILAGPFILYSYPLNNPDTFVLAHYCFDGIATFGIIPMLFSWIAYFALFFKVLKNGTDEVTFVKHTDGTTDVIENKDIIEDEPIIMVDENKEE